MKYIYTILFFYGLSAIAVNGTDYPQLSVLGVTLLTEIALWFGGDE